MQASLKSIILRHLSDNSDVLIEAQQRIDALDTSDMNLGEAQEANILAATGFSSLDDVLNSMVVIKKLKRAALIQVGCLLFVAGRFGECHCHLPSQFFGTVLGPSLPYSAKDRVFVALGITRKWDGRDYVHDYSHVPVNTPVGKILEEEEV